MPYNTLTGSEFFPVSNNKPRKAVIILHGVGADGENLMGLVPYLEVAVEDAYFVAPNAPHAYDEVVTSFGYMGYQWFSLQDRSYDKLSRGVAGAALKVKSFIDEVKDRFALEYKDIILMGFSQGCMTAIHTALRMGEGNELAGVVGFSGGTIVTDIEDSSINSKPPFCLIHGRDDDVVPFERSVVTESFLKDINVNCELSLLDGLNHSIDYNAIRICQKFLRKIS